MSFYKCFELRQSFLIRTVVGLLGEELPEVSSPVGRVAALVPFHPAVFQCQNPLDDTVEGMAVMGDDQHRALEVNQELFEPRQPHEIEVVARFVKHEKVRVVEQCQGQRQDVLFAARLRSQRLVMDALKTERIEDFFRLLGPAVAIDPIVAVSGFLVLLHRRIDLVRWGSCE